MEKILVRCQNILRNNDGVVSFDAFEEISKILFTIMQSKDKLDVNSLKYEYSKMLQFFSNDNINLKDSTIQEILTELYKISDLTKKDIKGRVYEIFLGKIFQSELGQFLTPKTIVKFITQFVYILYGESTKKLNILDPAMGSAGFLIEIIKLYSDCIIYGFDVNKRILDVGIRNLYLHNIDTGNVKLQNFLEENLEENSIDIVVTNPPFGVKESQQKILKNYELSKSKKQIVLEDIFIEKIIKILKPGGICGIVLPDGVLNNPTSSKVRKLLLDNCEILASIDLPENTFKSSGTGCETSILFFKKKIKNNNYNIYFGLPNFVGFETKSKNANEIDDNELPNIIENYGKNDDNTINLNIDNIDDRLDAKFYLSKYKYKSKTKISDICDISGNNVSQNSILKYIQFRDLNENLNQISTYTEYDDISELPNRAKIEVKEGDIICARLRQSATKISVVESEYDKHIVSNGFVVIRPKSDDIIDSYLISYILRSKFCQNQIKSYTSGTIMPSISNENFMNIYIPDIDKNSRIEIRNDSKKIRDIFETYKIKNKEIVDKVNKKSDS